MIALKKLGSMADRRLALMPMGRRLAVSVALTAIFVAVEVIVGLLSGSLALLTDAVHNLTDVMALALSWFGMRAQARRPNAGNTFGYHRVGILIALVNCTTLILVALGVFYEGIRRLIAPLEVDGEALAIVGLLALCVNLATARLIRRPGERDLNVRSAFVHLMGDVLSTAGATIAGVLILLTGADWIDPVVSLLIGGLILYNAWIILGEVVNILLESVPRDVEVDALVKDMLGVPGVLGVHDLHVWSLNSDMRTLSAHVITADVPISVVRRIQEDLSLLAAQRYAISHATLQMESISCLPGDLYCEFVSSAESTTSSGSASHQHRERTTRAR